VYVYYFVASLRCVCMYVCVCVFMCVCVYVANDPNVSLLK
jgi:hypothetical protein